MEQNSSATHCVLTCLVVYFVLLLYEEYEQPKRVSFVDEQTFSELVEPRLQIVHTNN